MLYVPVGIKETKKKKSTSLNIKFGVNWMFNVLKTPVYRFDLDGRYRLLWTDEDNFW